MEFEEMQAIWNQQDDANLFAIDQAALHAQIARKSRWVERKQTIFEALMVGGNVLAGILILLVSALKEAGPGYLLLGALYLGYALVGFGLGRARRREEARFAPTMLGELDKAIWQNERLIRHGKSIILWYGLPVVGLGAVVMGTSLNVTAGVIFLLVMVTLMYFGGRWEINSWYRPQAQSLAALREALVSAEDDE